MIVTCPGCSSKYRVSNDAVPAEGSRMRCPKCETLFLAKPPAAGAPRGPDDTGALQQLVPAPMANPPKTGSPVFPASTSFPTPGPFPGQASLGGLPRSGTPGVQRGPGVPAPGVPAQPQSGPITALFAAFDPGQLPPEAQRPPPPPPPAPRPSGLDLADGPKVKVATPSFAAPPPSSSGASSRGARFPVRPRSDSAALVAASWLGVVVGLASVAAGVAFFAWSAETANLDAALMPRFESTFGVEPPFSRIGRDDVAVSELIRTAEEAATLGDASTAIVLWTRARARLPADDQRPAAAIAKLRADLEDHEA